MVYHPFHIVENRPWPLIGSFRAFIFIRRIIFLFHLRDRDFFFFRIIIIIFIFFQWWRDVVRESICIGLHSLLAKKGLKLGIILFIVREVFFFFRFFWAYFHNILAPDIEIGIIWPPVGVTIFNPYHVPLLNTIILLSSGFTVTWAHYSIINKNFFIRKIGLLFTVLLGVYFSFLQGFEYYQALFTINDGIFGTVFFLITGFHGLHVLIGTIFLLVNLFRLYFLHFRNNFHLGFEARAWYWHFVDVVWLFLYVFVYWWIFYFVSIKSIFNFQLKGLVKQNNLCCNYFIKRFSFNNFIFS